MKHGASMDLMGSRRSSRRADGLHWAFPSHVLRWHGVDALSLIARDSEHDT